MQLSYKTPIWLYPVAVDFRKQIDGLVLLVADQLGLNPSSGELFIFRSRNAKKIKLLWYDDQGFWLCYKRLERGRLKFPRQTAEVFEINRDQLAWLLSGLDMQKQVALPRVLPTHFY